MKKAFLSTKRSYKIIRNHVVTGFIFLMPVLIAIAVLGKFWNQLLALGKKVSRFLYIDTVLGAAGDAIIAVILLLLFCVIAGFLVKLSIFKRMSDWLDEKLARFIPGYNDLRKETEKNIGVAPKAPKEEVFATCMIQTQGYWMPAYLIDVADNGDATVFIPMAPTYSTGQVAIISENSYKKLQIDSKALNEYLVKFGKGIAIA
ncbi:hypothetical protein [Pinibacter soli]|uniref:DUF502 domain-containing protein n=1 Tax=Pinibacter soli TaxID=3044211 RepID=A0ABT6R9L8_9BACT|nr:hypothetical protein [Pinibacter soli]MDI3319253.1 hypothetical protein [Pinibacter soli]